nr:Sec-independent protein translocase component tatA/E [Nitzschia ovalis]
MRISIGQILVLLIIIFLLFGDFDTLKKRTTSLLRQIIQFANQKDKKKGTWTPALRFWKPLLYQLSYFLDK